MTDDDTSHHRMTPGEKMRKVIELRYFHNMTLEQVGDLMGVTRERVRQIENNALRIMRNNPELRTKARDILDELNQI